mmetsp:Transcript_62623/g.101420  ORF Transcript_62623/g.101420 Transcript_62623/m.101420 type:complete len:211 (-) Transcript_62623:214-846(-)
MKAPLEKFALSVVDRRLHHDADGPNDHSFQVIQPGVLVADVAHSNSAEVVVDLACLITAEEVVQWTHHAEHRQTDRCQDAHADLHELQLQRGVQAGALGRVIGGECKAARQPAAKRLRWLERCDTCHSIIRVDQRIAKAEAREDKNYNCDDHAVCKHAAHEGIQIPSFVGRHASHLSHIDNPIAILVTSNVHLWWKRCFTLDEGRLGAER